MVPVAVSTLVSVVLSLARNPAQQTRVDAFRALFVLGMIGTTYSTVQMIKVCLTSSVE